MAVRQYVGARYVPKFATPTEWTASTSYEAFTIVTFNNASYTSKVQVPPTVGNPANNPKYWALTGNYNAQVEQYRQETQELSGKYDTLKNGVDKVSSNITKVSGDVTTLSSKVDSNTSAINTEITNRTNADQQIANNLNKEIGDRKTGDNALDQKITNEGKAREALSNELHELIATRDYNFKNRVFVFLGDSIARGYNGTGYNSTAPMTMVGQLLRCKQFYDFTANRGGFSSETGYSYMNVLTANESRITDKSAVTDFVIVGGINDTNKSNLDSTMPALFQYIKANYPNAQILNIDIAYSADKGPGAKQNTADLYAMYSNQNGVAFVDGSAIIPSVLNTLQSDGVHLNEYGSKYIANKVFNCIRTGTPGVNKHISGTCTYNEANGSGLTADMYINDTTASLKINFPGGWLALNSKSMTTNGKNSIKLCTLPNNFPNFPTALRLPRQPVRFWDGSTAMVIGDGIISILNREVYLYIVASAGDGKSYRDITTSSVWLETGFYTFPVIMC
jgi:lysophospholipase L1-like esterase